MIKIGKAFFDDEFRWGVIPSIGYESSDKYLVILQNGVKAAVTASDAMIRMAMEAIGYDAGMEPQLFQILDPEEAIELQPLVQGGCRWIAKDRRGICYAFQNEPVLAGAYWEDPQEAPSSRLFCDYAFLEEGEKQDLTPMLRGGANDE